jgi:hypothetical protein
MLIKALAWVSVSIGALFWGNVEGHSFLSAFEINIYIKVEGKEIPLQAWTSPEGSRRLRLPYFKTFGT